MAQVDPLFVFDLSNSSAPKVLGYLKIPGFSDYLHPLDSSATRLLGVGKHTIVPASYPPPLPQLPTPYPLPPTACCFSLLLQFDVARPSLTGAVNSGSRPKSCAHTSSVRVYNLGFQPPPQEVRDDKTVP